MQDGHSIAIHHWRRVHLSKGVRAAKLMLVAITCLRHQITVIKRLLTVQHEHPSLGIYLHHWLDQQYHIECSIHNLKYTLVKISLVSRIICLKNRNLVKKLSDMSLEGFLWQGRALEKSIRIVIRLLLNELTPEVWTVWGTRVENNW